MLVEAVERRFGAVEAIPEACELEFLTYNGSTYTAHETLRIAKSLGQPITHHRRATAWLRASSTPSSVTT